MMTTVFQRVGPYEIVQEVGRGGMAIVFLAIDSRDGRRVALKLVPTGTDREAREILEAESWGAKLQEQFCRISANVPVVFEHGTEGGYFYIAMEYLEGQNLSEVLNDGPIAPARAIGIGIQLCHFLEAAHGFEATIDGRNLRSLLHGDLKPRNIRVLEGDRIKVLDFGIAKALSLSRKVTRNDFGSIAYLSPERLESGEIDTGADYWAVGVLLYEMVSGVQPFCAPDTRRLEQRIRSLEPPPPLDASCPLGLQAVIAKLLTGNPADRYGDAKAIREDLESCTGGRPTRAQYESWPTRARIEPATRRTRPPSQVDAEATRRTSSAQVDSQKVEPSAAPAPAVAAPATPAPVTPASVTPTSVTPTPARSTPVSAPAQLPPTRRLRRAPSRLPRAMLLIVALAIILNELSVATRAGRVRAAVPTAELDGVHDLWDEYDTLNARSNLKLGITGLERALTNQTATLADRVIANYRGPAPTVREAQWRTTRDALLRAVRANPDNRQLRGTLRYCDGHLHRINGEARKARKQIPESQQEFTDAVTAFRESAELRPNWPDPFLGLMRTFVYGLEDVDRGADALKQAQRFGYTAGDRETAQLADGYRSRGDTLARSARALEGMPQERESLTRAAEAYRQAIDLYAKVLGFADVSRTMRAAQRGLRQIEQRLAELGTEVGHEKDNLRPQEEDSHSKDNGRPGTRGTGTEVGRETDNLRPRASWP